MRSIFTTRTSAAVLGLVLAPGLMLAGCDEPERDIGEIPYAVLSDYEFFEGDMAELQPAEGVLPYTVVAPLFSDNAGKGRYIVLPEGEGMTLTDFDEWALPVGTIIVKSFFFDTDRRDGPTDQDTRLVETRLLEVAADGLHSHIYRWNDEQTEAEYLRAGAELSIDYTDAAGDEQSQLYIIPDENACGSCHERDDELRVLGLATHQLNRELDGGGGNQIAWLAEQGALEGNPDPASLPAFADPDGEDDLDARARAYLHGNCAHCHRPGGGGGASGLNWLAWNDDTLAYGLCKVPAAAGPGAGGRAWDIVPGSPDDSIVVFRMASTDPEIKMPEVPSLLADDFGVELVSEWIAAMDPDDCSGDD